MKTRSIVAAIAALSLSLGLTACGGDSGTDEPTSAASIPAEGLDDGTELAADLSQFAAGVKVVDERKAGGYPTPVTHASGTDPVYVGRIREDLSHPRGLNMWVVADNIRKGAALNAVQVAELVANGG